MGHFIDEAIPKFNQKPTKESASTKTIFSLILCWSENYRTKTLYRQRGMFQNPRRKEIKK